MTCLERERPVLKRRGGLVGVIAVGALVVVAFVVIVAMGVHRPDPPMFAPTPVAPRPPAVALVGPELITVDARAADRWQFFSFAQGSVIERPGPRDWDLAFRRFQVIVNGGPGFGGDGGSIDLGAVEFADVRVLPADGYVVNTVRSDTVNSVMRTWYSYSYLSHRLSPRPRVYAVRTADGRHAKIEFAGYYCPGGVPGCVTLRYVFQGAGGVVLAEHGAGRGEHGVHRVPRGVRAANGEDSGGHGG